MHVKSGLPSPALENFAKYSDGLAVTGFMFNVGVRYTWCSKESDPALCRKRILLGSQNYQINRAAPISPISLFVISSFFQASNDELDPLVLALEKITEYGESIEFPPTGVTFDLNALIAPAIGSGNRYATYEGGLTTPTCNEVVRWINMETPLTLSAAQLAIFR